MLQKVSDKISDRIANILRKEPGQSISELAGRVGVNRVYLAGYLRALEDEGLIKSRRVGPARTYSLMEGKK